MQGRSRDTQSPSRYFRNPHKHVCVRELGKQQLAILPRTDRSYRVSVISAVASFGVHFICLKSSQSARHQKTTHLFKFHTTSALRSRMSCRATGHAPSVVLPRPSGIVNSLPKPSWELPHWSEPGLRFRKLTGRLDPAGSLL